MVEGILALGCVPLAHFALPGTTDVPDSIAPYCKNYNAVLLANHGALTWGNSLIQAYYRMETMEYYAKIHFNRDGDSDSDMHAHIIVSRKDRSNTKKLSPKTNHTGKKNCGNVKGGFDRTDFFRKCESSFDRRMGFDREPEESFDYLNAVKNGSPAEIARQVERAERIRKEKWDNLKAELQSRQEPEKPKIQQVEKTPDIEQPIPKKKQEEDLKLRQKPKRSRGFGMGM